MRYTRSETPALEAAKWVTAYMALFLAGCGHVAGLVAPEAPPAELLQACQEPPGAPKTNGELVGYAFGLREALRACDRDKTALREWASSLEKQ